MYYFFRLEVQPLVTPRSVLNSSSHYPEFFWKSICGTSQSCCQRAQLLPKPSRTNKDCSTCFLKSQVKFVCERSNPGASPGSLHTEKLVLVLLYSFTALSLFRFSPFLLSKAEILCSAATNITALLSMSKQLRAAIYLKLAWSEPVSKSWFPITPHSTFCLWSPLNTALLFLGDIRGLSQAPSQCTDCSSTVAFSVYQHNMRERGLKRQGKREGRKCVCGEARFLM